MAGMGWLLAVFLHQPMVWAGDLPLRDSQGIVHNFSEFQGKWVLVNYWATWCTPCLEEIPELVRFHAEHKETDAVVVGINREDLDWEALIFFINEVGINYPVWTSPPSAQTVLGPVTGLPTSFLISPQGEVVARQMGKVSKAMLERFIARQRDIRADD
ncbi:TlpA family protein disulfide reductase [Sedimenticola sp.]